MANTPYFLAVRTNRLSLSMFLAAVALCLCSAYLSATASFSRQLDTLLTNRVATSLRALTAQIDYRGQLITEAEHRAADGAAHPVVLSNRQGLLIEHWGVTRSLLSIEYPETSLARVDVQVVRIDKVYQQILQRISGSLDWQFLLTGMIEEDKQLLEALDEFDSLRFAGIFKSYSLPAILWLITAFMFATVPRCTRRDEITAPEAGASVAELTLESIRYGIISVDSEAKITFLNGSAQDMTGWPGSDALGEPLNKVFKICSSDVSSTTEPPATPNIKHGDISLTEGNAVIVSSAGGTQEIYSTITQIRDREERILGAVITFRDATGELGQNRKLIYQERHDSLTGLCNRNEFEFRLNRLCLSTRNQNRIHAMLYIDIDQFKVINDTCGHLAGDTLLKKLSKFLQGEVRHEDILARLGGDEFGVLINSCSEEQAKLIAEKLLYNIQSFRFDWKGKKFSVAASIGVATIHSPGQTVSSVMAAVDSACFAAKDAGRNRIVVYNQDNSKLAQRDGEMQWVARITQALEDNSFRLFFQSIVPIDEPSTRGLHYEVLLRLDTGKGLIAACEFLPAAEHYNLSNNIDRWVLSRTLLWLRQHPHHLQILDTCSINLSGQSISDENFLKFVSEQFHITRVPVSKICFEITETAVMSDLSNAVNFISTLKSLGCQFALDDFGSGLSSFGYLRDLEVDYLKIDGIFIKDMLENPVDESMVKSICQIGQMMKKKIVAEYVERTDLIPPLKACGIDYLQGNAIDPPKPIDELLNLPTVQSLAS